MRIKSFIVQKSFKKQFKKLRESVALSFEHKAYIFLDDQFHPSLNNHPLHGEWEEHWSINITGDIRAIYKIEELTAVFVAIGTHSELYE